MPNGTKRIFLERATSTKLVVPTTLFEATRIDAHHEIYRTCSTIQRVKNPTSSFTKIIHVHRCPRLLTRWSIPGIGGRVTFLHPRMEHRDETHRCERETTKLDKKLLQDWFLLNSCKVFVTMLIRIYYSTLVDWYNDMYPRVHLHVHTQTHTRVPTTHREALILLHAYTYKTNRHIYWFIRHHAFPVLTQILVFSPLYVVHTDIGALVLRGDAN